MYPKEESYVIALVKFHVIKVNKGKIITTNDGTLIPS